MLRLLASSGILESTLDRIQKRTMEEDGHNVDDDDNLLDRDELAFAELMHMSTHESHLSLRAQMYGHDIAR